MDDKEKTLDPQTDESGKKPTAKQLADENAKLQARIAELEAKSTADDAATVDAAAMTPAQYLEEKVKFKAFKDSEHYKDDLVVKVNGDRLQIPRGVWFAIPRKFYFALENAERQLGLAADVQNGFEEEFENDVLKRIR